MDVSLDSVAESLGLPYPISPPMQVKFHTYDKKIISGLDWGGNGPPVIFLHGGMLTARTWDLVCSLLRDRYHCLALDIRGHGDSDWFDEYTIPDCVADTIGVIEQSGWKEAHLVGMSLGGAVAAYTTLSEAGFKKLSLTMVDVAPNIEFEKSSRLRDFIAGDYVKNGAEALLVHARSLGARGTDEQLLYRYNCMIKQNQDKTWSWKSDNRKRPDFPHILKYLNNLNSRAYELTLPCLVIRGGLSQILTKSAAEDFVSRCPDARFKVVENAGHSVQEDNPIGLAKVLEEFWCRVA